MQTAPVLGNQFVKIITCNFETHILTNFLCLPGDLDVLTTMMSSVSATVCKDFTLIPWPEKW